MYTLPRFSPLTTESRPTLEDVGTAVIALGAVVLAVVAFCTLRKMLQTTTPYHA